MSVLYQSLLRRQITEEIYKKPTFEVQLEDHLYRGIVKKQKKFGKEFRRAMVHGVQFDIHTYSSLLAEQLQEYTRDHTGWTDIFLQIGSSTILQPASVANQHVQDLQNQLTHIQYDLLERYNLRPTVREHMPHATIVLSTDGSPEVRLKKCSASGRRMVHKSQRADLIFSVAEQKDREPFWQVRYSMSYDKGFSIVPREQFLHLMHFLTDKGNGQLFLAKKGNTIVSGSLCLCIDNQLIYLYGATDRSFGHLGAHYRLTLEILQRAKEQTYSSFDLLGIAPPGSGQDHPLAGVTRFKQSFGGETVVYAGSYDLALNKLLYSTFKTLRSK